jgi:phosphatidylserine decarboxylase
MSAATYVTAQIMRMLPRAKISRAVGNLADWSWPAAVGSAVVGLYSRVYDVDLDECEGRNDWVNFDEFFTRPLRKGLRRIDADPRTVVSPADGRLVSACRIDPGGTFLVKGRPYSVGELIGSDVEAQQFQGGSGFVVYLSPRDYHRVHAPVGGQIRRIRSIPGDYFPVNDVGMRHVPQLFCRNRRVAIDIEADGGLGRVTVVMVVAMIVGRITTLGIEQRDVEPGDHHFDPPMRVERGHEVGMFHLGSTAVVLVENRASAPWLASEGPIRLGAPLLRSRSEDQSSDWVAQEGAP